MTPDAFRAHLDRRGYSQAEFAREVRSNDRTVRRWACGDAPIPYSVQMLLEGRGLSKGEK